MTSPAPRIGLFGTFDLENFGDMLFPRIARRELLARLPGASIRVFAPFGYSGLNRFDDGREIETLGAWSWERAAELASDLDCVVVGGGEIIHDRDELLAPHYGVEPDEMRTRAPSRFFIDGLGAEIEREVPVLWNAVGIPFDIGVEQIARFRESLGRREYAAVRDEASARRLREAGASVSGGPGGRGGDVVVVPDGAFVIDRLFDPGLLQRRIDYLRLIGRFPVDVAPLVVQANRDLVGDAPALASEVAHLSVALGDAPVVAIEIGPCHGDADFTEAFASAYPREVFRPADACGLEDIAAIIAASAGFIGTSLHGNVTAFAFRRPGVVLALEGVSKLDEFANGVGNPGCIAREPSGIKRAFDSAVAALPNDEILRGLQKRVDSHFDRIAEIATEASWRRNLGEDVSGPAPVRVSEPIREELEQLRASLEVRGRRLVDERVHLADDMQELRTEIVRMEERLEVAKDRIEDLSGQLSGTKQELEDLRGTATFRYSVKLRAIYGMAVMPLRRRRQSRRKKDED